MWVDFHLVDQMMVARPIEEEVVVDSVRDQHPPLDLPLYVVGLRFQLGSVGRFASRLAVMSAPRLVVRTEGIFPAKRRLLP